MNETEEDKLIRHLKRTPFPELQEEFKIDLIFSNGTFTRSPTSLDALEKHGWTLKEYNEAMYEHYKRISDHLKEHPRYK